MTATIVLKIREIISKLDVRDGQVIFEDDFFQRVVFRIDVSPASTVKVICDSVLKEGLSCYYLSYFAEEPQQLELQFAHCVEQGRYGMLFSDLPEKSMLWMPTIPVVRSYNDSGHILDSSGLSLHQSEGKVIFGGTLLGGENNCIDVTLLQFNENMKSYQTEITNAEPIEERSVIRKEWFNFSGIQDIWKYLIQGKIYSTEIPGQKKALPAQNLDFTLYNYLQFLYVRTNKTIYQILRAMVAYALLISLPRDHNWRHGTFTNLYETHCRFQVSGILVLLSYYQLTRNELFLCKAEMATDALLVYKDELSKNAIWFLHDSLELNVETSDLYYKRHLHTNAFGKSSSNTLCLNTHMWTQILLFQLYSITEKEAYLCLIEKSMNALRKVLTHHPLGFVYGPVYFIRDILVNGAIKTNTSFLIKLCTNYEKLLRVMIIPFFKKRFPRLIMPNGYSERDLDGTSLSNKYHLVNIQDMLMLYRQTKERWIEAIIVKTLRHLSRTSHVRWVDRKGRKATIVLDIYLLAAGLIDDGYIDEFVLWLSYFHEKGTPLPVDMLSNPLVCGNPNHTNVANGCVFQFSLPSFEGSRALIINLGREEKRMDLSEFLSAQYPRDFIDMNGVTKEIDNDTIIIGPKSWLVEMLN